MDKMGRALRVLACVLVLHAGICLAQFSSSVQGTVTDSNGSVVPSATVSLVNEGNTGGPYNDRE